jgi:glycosyltransferase involved in cell wall biosynthesis
VTRKLRVLLVSPTFGAYGGIEAFVLALAECLSRDERFDLRVCFKRTAGFAEEPGFESTYRNVPIEFCARASAHLWTAIAWADIVHGQNASPDVAVIARLLGKPLALTIHNVLPFGPLTRRLGWRIAATTAAARWYNSRFVWRTWEHRPSAGSAHVPTTSLLPATNVEPPARRGFVFLGRLVPGKGADILLEAYERAALDPGLWPLKILGDGPARMSLEQYSTNRRMRGVEFQGFVGGDAKAQAVAAARWLVAPSHCNEAFGLNAVEARSLGVPCIVTSDGGLPEAAGRHALICRPADPQALAATLCRAAAMSEFEYASRSQRTKAELETELVAPSFYAEAYLELAHR